MLHKPLTLTTILTFVLLLPGVANADSIVVQGVPFFDTTLGTLTAVEVTIDPDSRNLPQSIYSSGIPIDAPEPVLHNHEIPDARVTFLGVDFLFPPVFTSTDLDTSPHPTRTIYHQ